jgi:hypothetical protein
LVSPVDIQGERTFPTQKVIVVCEMTKNCRVRWTSATVAVTCQQIQAVMEAPVAVEEAQISGY